MKRMKIIGVILAICGTLTLSACTGEKKAVPSSSPSATPQATEPAVSTPTPSPTQTPSASKAPSSAPGSRFIKASDKSAIGKGWSKIGEAKSDLDSDGVQEMVMLYTSAQRSGGAIEWDDRQKWVLEVKDGDKYFTLYEKDVQNGNLYFEIADYYQGSGVVPTITLLSSTGTELSVRNYVFEETGYVETSKFNSSDEADGAINKTYSSVPEIE
jgi:hypothetical protein